MSDVKDKIIGGFRVLLEIQAGSGSQGTVYKAVCADERDGLVPAGTIVALKVMAVQDEGRAQWRKLEKRTAELARMNSPNVVRYYGCFSEPGLFNDVHVVVQEFLQGETLKERLTRFPAGLDADEALRIAEAVLSGLVYTSGCGIIHRDIKPGNIFLCDDGSVKLIDFEIARQNGGTTTSSTGNIRGSFDYMAPDFTDADFHGDVQSDIFSMGVVLHEMLTGKTPYQRLEGDDRQANFAFLSRWAHSLADGTNPMRISSRINRLLAHTEDVMVRSLAPRREDRYGSFEEFRAGLKSVRFRNLRNGQSVYQMLQFIGKGGFGEVFKARLRQTGRLVAVKHLLKADYAERFYREAKIMKKLNDSCFVQLVDFFMMDVGNSREAFLVMAFLDGMPGSSLRDAIRNAGDGRLPELDVLTAFERYARGLQIMHAEGIYHRDIKPSNLYFPAGHPETAAIMDLGIARDVNGTATHGQVPGTLEYMPPEVVITDNRGDGGMDIYALGLCFYEALTLKAAFPRLPTGSATYAAFFDRARSKRKPNFDDEIVQSDHELLALLTDMTNPELSSRIRDAAVLVERIRALRKRRFPNATDAFAPVGETQADGEGVAETASSEGATQGTVLAQWGKDKLEALERERRQVRKRRDRQAPSAAFWVFVCIFILVAVGAGVAFAWKPMRYHFATEQLDAVLQAYREGDEDAGQRMESAWKIQWSPKSHNWLTLDETKYTQLVGRLEDARKRPTSDEEKKLALLEKEKTERLEKEMACQNARERVAACFTADGKLVDEKFLDLDGWELPEAARGDEEIKRRMGSMGEALTATITGKLAVHPPLTRRERLRKARELLRHPWTTRVLPAEERERLRTKIDDVSSWCVVTVRNKCDTVVRIDGRTIAVGGSEVFEYRDGHPEKATVTRQGFEPRHLPANLDGPLDIGEDFLTPMPRPQPVITNNPAQSAPKPAPKPVPAMSVVTNNLALPTPKPAPKPAPATSVVTNNLALPTPKPAPKSADVIRAEIFVADVQERLRAEPVVGRRDRLQKAYGLINDSRTPDILAVLEGNVKKELEDLYEAEDKRVRGIVVNKTELPVRIDVGDADATLKPGEERMVTFDRTWTSARYARVEGYEYVMLPHEQETFEKFTFFIRTSMLVPLPVNVTVPELDPGVTCKVSGRSEFGVFWIVSGKSVTGTFELRPGLYECVYEKPDCERQILPFKVEMGVPLTLPRPKTWRESGTFGWIGQGFASAVDGIKNAGSDVSVKSGAESRENFLQAVDLRKKAEAKAKKEASENAK